MNSTADELARRLRELPLTTPDPRLVSASVLRRLAEPQTRPPRSRPARGPLVGLGSAAAAVAMLVAAVVLTADLHRSGAAQPAREVLLTAARQSEATPVATGRYWHTAVQMNGVRAVSPPGTISPVRVAPGTILPAGTPGPTGNLTTERWVAASDSDVTWFGTQLPGAPRPVLHQADPNDWGAHRFDLEGRALTVSELQQLPTDPAALRAFLLAPYPEEYRRLHPTDLELRLFDQAFELALAPVRPEVRAAAFRIMADLPGVRSLGRVKDALGRSGVGVAITSGGTEHELIIDAATGSVLDLQDVPLDAGPGATVHYQAILASGWTSTVDGTS